MPGLIPDPSDVEAAWAAKVRANREQVERLGERSATPDFYAPVASAFRADPRRTDEPALEYLRTLVVPGEAWLDIGGGAGRYALPLTLQGARVTVFDPSRGMLDTLAEVAAEFAVEGAGAVQGRWPEDAGGHNADVCLISHVGYDVEGIGPFLDAMVNAARRLCVAVLLDQAPASAASAFWPAVHGEAREELPALREFLVLLLAKGFLPSVTLFERGAPEYGDRERLAGFLRHQLWVEPGSEKDRKLTAELERRFPDGTAPIQLGTRPIPLGVVTWSPQANQP